MHHKLLEPILVNNNMDGVHGQLGQLVAHNVDLVKNQEGETVREYNVAQIFSTNSKIKRGLAEVPTAVLLHRLFMNDFSLNT